MSLRNVALKEEYRTGQADLVSTFYRPCLSNATRYDRAVGFFRSSVFLLIGPDFLSFALRGGRVRLLCSPSLTEEDYEAIRNGYELRDMHLQNVVDRDIDDLLTVPRGFSNTEALATLICHDVIEIKLAIRPEAQGIYHEKLGLFFDDSGNCISFKGSVNETWNGWHDRGNFESFDTFCNWEEDRESVRVENSRAYFEQLWLGEIAGLDVIDFPQAAKDRLTLVAKNSISDINEDELTDFFSPADETVKRTEVRETAPISTPKRTPLPHQLKAIEAWKAQGMRGILEHATGSGKTFTALLALKEHLEPEGVALILVPDRLLHQQWNEELKNEFNSLNILKAGSGHNRWRRSNNLRHFTSPLPGLGKRIVLATMPTARKAEFINGLAAGKHLLIIADEVHEIGSKENSKALAIETGTRLGLSATPQRYSDHEGTRKILDYFGPVLIPPYTLVDAIRDRRLVPYEYHPIAVKLTAEESDEWKQATVEISRAYARSKRDRNGDIVLSPALKIMLIQRARIAKRAAKKVPLVVDVVRNHFKRGENWLVYCEDQSQLTEVMQALKLADYEPLEYHTNMEGSATASLSYFIHFGGIMCAIRCLDQGIDIPKISHAVILASSQNPRQFIQRRGRVLRTAPGKYKASIFDAIMTPVDLTLEPEQLSLLKSEFQRSIQFAKNALNRGAANELIRLASELGIDPEEVGLIESSGIEEDIADA